MEEKEKSFLQSLQLLFSWINFAFKNSEIFWNDMDNIFAFLNLLLNDCIIPFFLARFTSTSVIYLMFSKFQWLKNKFICLYFR